MDKKEIERLKAEQPDHKHAFEMKEGGYIKTLESKYRKAAKAKYNDPGHIEVDPCGEVSIGSGVTPVTRGAYVQAWVYVDADDLEEGENK